MTLILGSVVATPGALAAIERNEIVGGAGGYIARHSSGDWGDLSKSDANAQLESLKSENQDERIMSVYRLGDGAKIWIMTEWDRSVTTVLLPEEY